MRDLTYDEFTTAWSTYWGRREFGVVLDNRMASHIGSDERSLRTFYDQWRAALAIHPEDAPLWLMGTPDLSPGLLAMRSQTPAAPPPVPRVGPYVTQTPSVSGLSQRAGDYVITLPRNSPAARTGRRIARGQPGIILGAASLLLIWAPLLALPMAAIGLVWTSQAGWELRGPHVPRRFRWRIVAGQVIAVVSIGLTVILAVNPGPTTTPAPREEIAVTEATQGTLGGDIVERLRLHWPEIEVSAGLAVSDRDGLEFVRIRVADGVFLDAIPGELTWSVQPMTDVSGSMRPAQGSRQYGIGVTTDDGAEAIADRLYEEVRFWWAKLHPAEA